MNILALTQRSVSEVIQIDDISRCRVLLETMTNNWHRRAQVTKARKRVEKTNQPEWTFDQNKADFRIDLLPFKDHPLFQQASASMKQKILSCGWLAYNEKTVEIESKIISPVCNHIIDREIPGLEDEASRQIASDTLIDEAYHIQLVVSAAK